MAHWSGLCVELHYLDVNNATKTRMQKRLDAEVKKRPWHANWGISGWAWPKYDQEGDAARVRFCQAQVRRIDRAAAKRRAAK